MSKSSKIVVFIIVAIVISLIATILKEAGAGAVMSIAALAIWLLYSAMFKKKKPEETKDITLNK